MLTTNKSSGGASGGASDPPKDSGGHGNKANKGENTKTLFYFAITVTLLAVVLEFAKVFCRNTPLENIMLGTASHTCVAVLMILAIFETWRQQNTVINKIGNKFGFNPEKSRNILIAITGMVVLAMGMMAASEYHNQKANSEKKTGSDTSHALAGVVVAFIVIALTGKLFTTFRRKS